MKVVKHPRTVKVDNVITRNFKFVVATNLTTNQDAVIGNAKATFVTSSMGFRLSLIPGIPNYKACWTHFRFDRLKIRFIPITITAQVEDSNAGTSASGISKATPMFYISRIYGNEVPSDLSYENENSCLMDGARGYKMTRGFTIKWVPNTLTPVQTSRSTSAATLAPNTGWQVLKKHWHSLNDWGTCFYGLKYAITATNLDDYACLYKCIATATISFKGPNDANYTQGGGVSTVVIPCTDMTS